MRQEVESKGQREEGIREGNEGMNIIKKTH